MFFLFSAFLFPPLRLAVYSVGAGIKCVATHQHRKLRVNTASLTVTGMDAEATNQLKDIIKMGGLTPAIMSLLFYRCHSTFQPLFH